MDDQIRTLIALGASAAANCRPCLDRHLGAARGLHLDETSISEAIDIGIAVNQGAGQQTRKFVDELLETSVVAAAAPGSAVGRCC